MSNKKPLKSYIRYDGSGRAVSSSLIWRKNKPKVGNWKEVQGYECCNPEPGPTFTPIELCFGPSPCTGNCTVGTYYIYQAVLGGIPISRLLKSEDPGDPANNGVYARVPYDPSYFPTIAVYGGAILDVGPC